MDVINGIIKSIGDSIGWALKSLSFSPFSAVSEYLTAVTSKSEFLKMLNWVFPVAQAVALLEVWALCIGLWYGASVLLRWFKAVE